MPYESFASAPALSIRGVVQDAPAGGWRYLIQVARPSAASPRSTRASDPKLTQASVSALTHSSGAPLYTIRRSLRDLRRLHDAMAPLMGRALPKLPVDSLLSFLVGETRAALHKKRPQLEALLQAVAAHPAASDSPEFRAFLAESDPVVAAHALLSPAPSSRSSFSMSDADGLTPVGGSRSAAALRRALYQQQRQDAPHRRRSLDVDGERDAQVVEFSHFSMT